MTLFSPLFPSAAMLAFAMAFLPTLSQGQECSQGRIGEVEVIRLDVFEVEAESEGTLVGWALRTANRIHINTTEGYIRSELFFEEGDCFDPFLLEESARTLRSRAFIIWAEISSEPLPDGEIKVTVEVRDDWTLELGLGLSFDEGVNL